MNRLTPRLMTRYHVIERPEGFEPPLPEWKSGARPLRHERKLLRAVERAVQFGLPTQVVQLRFPQSVAQLLIRHQCHPGQLYA